MADAIIIGGGVMGCSIALRLAQAGVSTTVLERAIPGAEASSAAAGILAPQMESDGPGPFLELSLRSRGLYPEFARELEELSGLRIDYLPTGLLQAAFDEDQVQALEATVAWQRASGLRAELLEGADARALEPALSPQALAAIHFPDDHQVDNRLLVRALSMATARVGARFQTGNVRGLLVEDGRVIGVDVDGERLHAEHVVLAAGSWSGLVQGAPLDPRTVRPARGQMVMFQTRLPLLQRVLKGPGGYLVPRKDGRVIAGSTMELVGFEKQVTAGGLQRILETAVRLCPALESAPVIEHWAGLRPYTEDTLPILGPGPLPGLTLATGHFRNGILLAPITARLMTQWILGKSTTVDLTPFLLARFSSRT